MRNVLQIVAPLFCICLCGCEITDSTINTGASTQSGVAYVHSDSKFSFPKQIEKFQFVESHVYDRYGKDISVGYNSPTPIAATVYVYPAAKNFSILPGSPSHDVSETLIDHEFELRKLEISKTHSDARLISEEPCEIIQGNNRFKGKKAIYSMTYRFGPSNQDCLSELYIFLIEPGVMFLVNDRQYVEYRITYPLTAEGQATNEITAFLSDLTWPNK
jgi:Bacteriophage peptidoglycan hydrolase